MQRRVLAASIAAVAVAPGVFAAPASGGKLRVAVSFNALKEFVEAVGGDKVSVSGLIPADTEPHGFTPTIATMGRLKASDLFVVNGLGMEPWAEKTASVAAPGLKVVTASRGFTPIKLTDPGEIREHGDTDPHVWLSLSGAVYEADAIRKALSALRPADAPYFNARFAAFKKPLEALAATYAARFKSAKRRVFVTSHAAFAYLCRDFGLTQLSVEDIFAEGEPTIRKLADLAKLCRREGVKTIFTEEMVSPAVARTLAKEAGAKVKVIYTMETAEGGKTYAERMKANLEAIALALNE